MIINKCLINQNLHMLLARFNFEIESLTQLITINVANDPQI